MVISDTTVSLTASAVAAIQEQLRASGLDGWLLYDFRGVNPVAAGAVGLPAMTRRYFVLIPAEGEPVAITHRIEQQPWEGWIGVNRPYLTWRELERELSAALGGLGTVAAEYSEGDAVPYADRVPAGVLELIRAAGVRVVSSADLVSAFYSAWTQAGLESHLRAATLLRQVAHDAFARIGECLGSGGVGEWEMREWIRSELERRGLGRGVDSIVAASANASNPHYAPSRDRHAAIRPADVVLIDLWGKEDDEAIFADQTWMGYVGEEAPERLQRIWETVRDAREAAIRLLRERHSAGQPVAGYEADDAARGIIDERGFGAEFIHRTGHSIDRELHGSGPNLDNLETRDTRRLIPGVGFSVEPGVYIAGDVGFRSEVNVYMAPAGPRVTTPEPQTELVRILPGG